MQIMAIALRETQSAVVLSEPDTIPLHSHTKPSPLLLSWLLPDGSPLRANPLAFGRTGVIVKRGDRALKIPRRDDMTACAESNRDVLDTLADIAHDSIEHEKAVYRHLGEHDGIVRVFQISDAGIEMPLMTNGDLADYLRERRPEKRVQLDWIRQMASTIDYVHKKRVIIADIATKNFLLADDLSVKLCDFTESTIMPPGANIEEDEDSGFSIQTDIAQFGSVIYEIVTPETYNFDLFKGQGEGKMVPTWLCEQDLPNTEDIWLGSIIRKCWTKGGYRNMGELCRALELESATLK